MNVIIQRQWFSMEQCENNKLSLYIFGDNMISIGTGGQAQIRYCNNSFGIPTKRLPSMTDESFFNDRDDEKECIDINISQLKSIIDSNIYENIILPYDGLGTGLAEMDKRSPYLFKYLNDSLSKLLNISYMKEE